MVNGTERVQAQCRSIEVVGDVAHRSANVVRDDAVRRGERVVVVVSPGPYAAETGG